MIGFLRGTLLSKSPPQLLLDVNGVGYEIEAPMTTFYDLPGTGQSVNLFTHLIVREDAHILFGFATETERVLFRALIKVNGIGPKLALTILSGQSVADFYRCVEESDVRGLVRLPGVGQKTAERLIIEMRDRLPALDLTDQPRQSSVSVDIQQTGPSPRQEAISALCALGYKPQDAAKMIQAIKESLDSSEAYIRAALKGAVR